MLFSFQFDCRQESVGFCDSAFAVAIDIIQGGYIQSTESVNPEICPHCGADVPDRAKACPECGSTEETGWSEEAATDRLDLPGQSFDYEEFTEREFGAAAKRSTRTRPLWKWVGIGLLVLGAVGSIMSCQ
jgi:hypothetical protein